MLKHFISTPKMFLQKVPNTTTFQVHISNIRHYISSYACFLLTCYQIFAVLSVWFLRFWNQSWKYLSNQNCRAILGNSNLFRWVKTVIVHIAEKKSKIMPWKPKTVCTTKAPVSSVKSVTKIWEIPLCLVKKTSCIARMITKKNSSQNAQSVTNTSWR